MSRSTLRLLAVLWIGLLAGFAVGSEWLRQRPWGPPPPSGGIDLVGAGATLPYPLYRRWFADYAERSGVRINYLSVGTGEGLRLLLEEDVDFGASDRPLRADEKQRARCDLVDIPMVAGAIVVAYQLPGIREPLRLDPQVLAEIYSGRVTRWDAPALRALNPTLALPALDIVPVFRARSSGTSEVFSQWLASETSWPRDVTPSESRWPVGVSAEGNEGVASQLQVTAGAIGFVELSYAVQSRLSVAMIKNAAGVFVLPTEARVGVAATELLTPATADTMGALIGARNAEAWPIVAVTRLIADRAVGDSTKGAHFVAFARWALRDGARAAGELGYAALPNSVAAAQQRRIDSITPGQCRVR